MHTVRRRTTLQVIGVTTLSLLLGGAGSAHATDFAFTFTSANTTASGFLQAILNPDNLSYTATSGYINVVGPPSVTGMFNLLANPNGTNQAYSPTGNFTYDNQLFPASSQTLDIDGLLFKGGTTEINLFNNGTDIYYEGNNGSLGYNTPGQFTLTAVPEPAFYQMSGLLALGGLGFMRNRRKKAEKAE